MYPIHIDNEIFGIDRRPRGRRAAWYSRPVEPWNDGDIDELMEFVEFAEIAMSEEAYYGKELECER